MNWKNKELEDELYFVDCITKIVEESRPDETPERILSKILDRSSADYAMYLTVSMDTNLMTIEAQLPNDGTWIKDHRGDTHGLDKGIASHVINNKTFIYVPDVSKSGSYHLLNLNIKSELLIPIISNQNVAVIIILSSKEENKFDNNDIEKIRRYIYKAAPSIVNSFLLLEAIKDQKAIQEQNDELRELRKIEQSEKEELEIVVNLSNELLDLSRIISDSTDHGSRFEDFYQRFCITMKNLLQAEYCSLWIVSPDNKWGILRGQSDREAVRKRNIDIWLESSIIGKCVDRKLEHIETNIDSNKLRDQYLAEAFPDHTLLAIPLIKIQSNETEDRRSEKRVIGILSVIYKPDKDVEEIIKSYEKNEYLIRLGIITLERAFLVEQEEILRSFRSMLQRIQTVQQQLTKTAVDTCCAHILEFLHNYTGGASIFVVQGDHLVCRYSTGIKLKQEKDDILVPPDQLTIVRYKIGEGRTGGIAETKEASTLYWGQDGKSEHPSDDLNYWGPEGPPSEFKSCEVLPENEEPTSWIGLPIFAGNHDVIGVIRAKNRKPLSGDSNLIPFFTDVDINVFQQIASVFSLILKIEQTDEEGRQQLNMAIHDVHIQIQRITSASELIEKSLKQRDELDTRLQHDLSDIRRAAYWISSSHTSIRFDTPYLEHKILKSKTLINKEIIRPIANLFSIKPPGLKFPHHELIKVKDDTFYKIPALQIDRDKIFNVFYNVISNAHKYSFEDPEDEVISQEQIEIEGDFDASSYLVHVSDYGIGIDDEDIPFLFQERFRSLNSYKRHFTGMGLGLYSAMKIMELHEGTIKLSNQKSPTKFTVVFPKKLKV